MLRLFTIKNSLFNDDDEFERRLALVDGERRQKVNSLTVREKKNASLAAGVILPLALKACGIAGTVEIERDKWEKPRLVSPKGLFFNLSHSDERTVLALSDGEVGVDIQQVKPGDMRLATRFFSPEECETLRAAGEDATALFYRLWTVKEAYLKALGTGLTRPLSSFTVRLTEDGAEICDPEAEGSPWRVREYFSLEGYAVACCAQTDDFPQEICELFI